jgi:hypothetical protein
MKRPVTLTARLGSFIPGLALRRKHTGVLKNITAFVTFHWCSVCNKLKPRQLESQYVQSEHKHSCDCNCPKAERGRAVQKILTRQNKRKQYYYTKGTTAFQPDAFLTEIRRLLVITSNDLPSSPPPHCQGQSCSYELTTVRQ